jgi:hypothetical protein
LILNPDLSPFTQPQFLIPIPIIYSAPNPYIYPQSQPWPRYLSTILIPIPILNLDLHLCPRPILISISFLDLHVVPHPWSLSCFRSWSLSFPVLDCDAIPIFDLHLILDCDSYPWSQSLSSISISIPNQAV